MQHPDEGTIHAWLDGALSVDEAARVEAHIKDCPQCAAAVAEARGFIAGASRILTALDNAPRGVIPAAAPKKRVDPWILRMAATVLVVAAGTLVVVRENGSKTQTASTVADRTVITAARPTAKAVEPAARVAAEGTRATGQRESLPSVRGKPSGKTPTADALQSSVGSNVATALADSANVPPAFTAAPPPSASLKESRTVPFVAQGGVLAGENKVPAGQVSGVATDKPASAAANANVGAPSQPAAIRIRGASSYTAFQQPPLKVVGTERRMGATLTFYEVAPGDTVTLKEESLVNLEGVVVTGMSVQQRSMEKSAAAAPTRRADSAVASVADSQRSADTGRSPTRAAAPPTPAPVVRADVTDGVTTITWADATTGKMLRLSGRMPEARLQQIKIRIEQERAAAAAKKKNP